MGSKKLSRREFLKSLAILSSISFVGLDFKAFKQNISDFSKEELENIAEIESIETREYFPYFRASHDLEYVVTKKSGTIEYYIDTRRLQEEYGNILDYWNEVTGDDIPDIYSTRYNGKDWLL